MSNTELLNQLLNLTIWLSIKGYENYEVSISGRVRNITTKMDLKQYKTDTGHYQVVL